MVVRFIVHLVALSSSGSGLGQRDWRKDKREGERGELEAREYVCLVLENVEYNSINKRIGGSRQEI